MKHAEDWLIFSENIGSSLSIDETALIHGELYTIITNKAAKGRKGAVVAIISGTNSENIISILTKIPIKKRKLVQEVTLDMAGSMNLIAKKVLSKCCVSYRSISCSTISLEVLQELRIKH